MRVIVLDKDGCAGYSEQFLGVGSGVGEENHMLVLTNGI